MFWVETAKKRSPKAFEVCDKSGILPPGIMNPSLCFFHRIQLADLYHVGLLQGELS
jgi:hypothetical protein